MKKCKKKKSVHGRTICIPYNYAVIKSRVVPKKYDTR